MDEQRIWLLSGTGEGPPLAAELLRRGWQLRVSVVSSAAARAYPAHPNLELKVGALGDGAAVQSALAQWPCRWVVDAAHPFAHSIHPAVAKACAALGQPLLRLQRPMFTSPGPTVLAGLEELATLPLEQDSLLLALGARELAAALRYSRAREHAVRLLPSATALGQALQLGLPAERIACLRPQTSSSIAGSVEAGLCRRWGITAVLARQSGGPPEQQWHQICQAMDLKLLLLARPESSELNGLEMAALLARLGWPS